jgi:rhodanese-related sulfurtransferase
MLAPACALAAGLFLQTPQDPASPLRLPGARTAPPPAPAEPVVVDTEWVAAHYGEAGVVLVDLRDAADWRPFAVPPAYAGGHIPMSLPFDFRHLVVPGGGWPSQPAVLAALEKLGPRPDSPVDPRSTFILYGQDESEPQLGLGYLVLSAAGLEARVFAAGWQSWHARSELPVVRVVGAREVADLMTRGSAGGGRGPAQARLDPRPLGPVILDLREASDFRAAHLPGARSAPFDDLPGSLEAALAAGWPGVDPAATPIVLYCYGTGCIRSYQGSAVAARRGFRDILWLREGLEDWRAQALPLEAEPAPPDPKLNLAVPPASP